MDSTDPFNMPFPNNPNGIPTQSAQMNDTESCNSWTEAGIHSPTVSMARLSVPGKANNEYKKGCGALKDKRLQEAETHLRNAIAVYPNYVAAWVVLGQILDQENNRDDARKACAQAETIDPSYSPPYLCLADFAVADNDWKQVQEYASRALEVNPVHTADSLYFSAIAAFHLNRMAEAEAKGLEAVKLDLWHHMPELHLLLAHVYEAKGDIHAEAEQLKEYLKVASSSPSYTEAKTALAQLESHP
jgi:tetratricopeptide (TPR) repeat protein